MPDRYQSQDGRTLAHGFTRWEQKVDSIGTGFFSRIPNSRSSEKPDWKNHGLRIIRSGDLNTNTPQTPGMTRAEAISRASVGAQKLWAGTVVVQPNAKTGPHHHGDLETVIYVVRGRARFRWGNRLEFRR